MDVVADMLASTVHKAGIRDLSELVRRFQLI